MKQALLEESQEWDIQFSERRLALVDDDIEATKKQIQSLEKQRNSLHEKFKNYEYTLDEIKTTIETLQGNEFSDKASNDDDSEGDFFTILSELENEEVALKGELESYQQLKKQLAHDRRKLLSVNSKIQSEVESDRVKLEAIQDEMQTSEDLLKDLQYQIDAKTLQYNELFQQCSDMHQEELRITEELKRYGETLQADLHQAEKDQTKQLEDTKKREIELEKALANTQRKYQKTVNSLNRELENQCSVSNWMNDRSLLIGKVRKAKTQLATEKQSIEGAEKRKAKMESDLKKVLGDNDPGDGTGPKAKQMVLAEIERLKSEKQFQAFEGQIQTEKDYNEELKRQLSLLTSSVDTFNQHKNETLNSLNEELEECSRDGYLKLLRNELTELQTQLCNY